MQRSLNKSCPSLSGGARLNKCYTKTCRTPPPLPTHLALKDIPMLAPTALCHSQGEAANLFSLCGTQDLTLEWHQSVWCPNSPPWPSHFTCTKTGMTRPPTPPVFNCLICVWRDDGCTNFYLLFFVHTALLTGWLPDYTMRLIIDRGRSAHFNSVLTSYKSNVCEQEQNLCLFKDTLVSKWVSCKAKSYTHCVLHWWRTQWGGLPSFHHLTWVCPSARTNSEHFPGFVFTPRRGITSPLGAVELGRSRWVALPKTFSSLKLKDTGLCGGSTARPHAKYRLRNKSFLNSWLQYSWFFYLSNCHQWGYIKHIGIWPFHLRVSFDINTSRYTRAK